MAPLLVVGEAKSEQRTDRRKRIEAKCDLAQFDRFVEAAEPEERLGLSLKAHAVAGVEGERAIDLGRCLLVLGAREMDKADHAVTKNGVGIEHHGFSAKSLSGNIILDCI